MKAIVYQKYGSPDVLQLEDVDTPAIDDGDVLVRVRAASVNSWDWDLLRGTPFLNRLGALRTPKHKILGADIAGQVEAVGRDVSRFQPGDEVYGDLSGCGWGGFAEYVSAAEDALAPKPANLTFEDAAAVPQAGVLAVQGLRLHGPIQPGQHVLVNGAGGGVGTFAVQIARSFGAEVTGVDSTEKLDMVRSIGADHVIDYTQDDFTSTEQRYDVILDCALHRSIFDCRRALAPRGTHILIGGSAARIIQAFALATPISIVGGKKTRILLHKPGAADLAELTALLEAGTVVPVIDRRYTLSEVPEALRYFGEGHVQGKIVITV